MKVKNSFATISVFRHIMGIIGTALIFGADVFYSSRKYGQIGFGKLRWYLQAHVLIGIFGPILILWHAGLSFDGFAGFAMIVTLTVLASGFFGRYIFKLLPRKMNGHTMEEMAMLISAEVETRTLIEQAIQNEISLEPFIEKKQHDTSNLGFPALLQATSRSFKQRFFFRFAVFKIYRSKWTAVRDLTLLFYKRSLLDRQIQFFYVAKDMMSRWKIFHIPLTIALFLTIITHVFSVFYYGKFI